MSRSPTSTRCTRRSRKAGSPYAANRCVAIMSKMFSLAVRWGMRETNPCKGIERHKEHHRRRYLSGDELGRLVAALAEHPDRQVADAIRLLLLTGARRGEVLGMRWGDIDLTAGKWSKTPSSTKQNTTPRGAAERTGPRATGPHPPGTRLAETSARRIRLSIDRQERPPGRDQEGLGDDPARPLASRTCACMTCGIATPARWFHRVRACR